MGVNKSRNKRKLIRKKTRRKRQTDQNLQTGGGVIEKIDLLKAFNPNSGFNRFKPGFKSVFDKKILITKDEVIDSLQKSQEKGTCPLLKYLRQILKIVAGKKNPSVFSQKEEDNCDDLLKLKEINWASGSIDNTYDTFAQHYNEVLSWLKEPKVRILLIFKNLQKVESFSLISSGLNGTTYKVTFEEGIHAVLKVPKRSKDDNLYYEFRVGQHLNRLVTIYPCFIRTYGLFESDNINVSDLQSIKNMKVISETEKSIGYTCKNSGKLALMIENIEKPMTIDDYFDKSEVFHDVYGILFQVYFPLFQLQGFFTHNDLNLNNVMLHKPFNDRYIQMNYHMRDGIISFKSQYVVKIIDYSRSFIKEFSEKFLQDVCNENECKPDCGINYGYEVIMLKQREESKNVKELRSIKQKLDNLKAENTAENTKLMDYLRQKYKIEDEEQLEMQIFGNDNAHDPTKPNVSIDLWFLDEIIKSIKNLFSKETLNKIRKDYGIQYEQSTYDESRDVNNVTDAFKMLKIAMAEEASNNDKMYEDWTLGATMDVYDNGQPYEYRVV
jgi:hypothetical protein